MWKIRLSPFKISFSSLPLTFDKKIHKFNGMCVSIMYNMAFLQLHLHAFIRSQHFTAWCTIIMSVYNYNLSTYIDSEWVSERANKLTVDKTKLFIYTHKMNGMKKGVCFTLRGLQRPTKAAISLIFFFAFCSNVYYNNSVLSLFSKTFKK